MYFLILFGVIYTIIYYKSSNEKTKKTFTIPILQLNIKELLKIPQKTDLVNYLNGISKIIDRMYIINKTHQPKTINIEKRIKPIFFYHKFNLAKLLYEKDLVDNIKAIELDMEIHRDQIEHLIKRIPSNTPFLVDKKYSPYFWILSDYDYERMDFRVKKYIQEDNFNLIKDDFDEFISQKNIRMRFNVLLQTHAKKYGLENLVYDEKVIKFNDFCFEFLQKRFDETQTLIRNKKNEIRNLQKEKSKRKFELESLKKLNLDF
jgi:hypothetical protein